MNNYKRRIITSGIMIIACILMYLVESYIRPDYAIKSLYKIIIFAGLPLIYCAFDKEVRFKEYFRINDKKQIKFAVMLGLGVYLLIQAGYYILKGFIDLDNIAMNLENNLSINKDNFIFVSLYISFINSLLEELFFRGFGFITLRKFSSKRYTYIISSLAFSVYHVSILANWFNIIIYALFITGLFVTGLFFNRLNDRYNNILNSWIVHMCANFSINTIGLMMFGMI
ncbi:CPBP family intramembrane metalloprotease [Sedimentibacter hydroxybenzoicus DSM 7310]|uniref:CPBP family intramembrane metalloprotease n=1 Tax=Sedimentibacter hydroxybenzoicus DSM 7310 TaxID=1123245 RepID=A0A974BHL9_SEDHY|nr:CPBP family intramembrane glutamic endopeptidase [Sedimentibacter hydroxybenzoicus]NYB73320.1 CPBP family intramembrane metalloprotease [Sedimentibacter hydroxybenzoicus DSM 7310]